MTLSINCPSSVFRVQEVHVHECFTSPRGLTYSPSHLVNFYTSLSIKRAAEERSGVVEFSAATEISLNRFERLDSGPD